MSTPPGLAAHPRRGFVRAHHRACDHGGLDRRRRGHQRCLRARQHVADRALADAQREDLVQQQRQPFHADGMGIMQIHHQRRDRLAERRSRLQPGRRGRGRPLAAARAPATEQPHPRHVRPDWRQLEAVIDLLRRLLLDGEGGGAMRAGIQGGIDDAVRLRVQRPADAGAAWARRLGAGGTFGLLPFRRRQRGIVRCLGRTLEPGKPRLQFGDARQRRLQLPDQWQQRQDEGILLRDGQLAEVDLGGHTQLESSRP